VMAIPLHGVISPALPAVPYQGHEVLEILSRQIRLAEPHGPVEAVHRMMLGLYVVHAMVPIRRAAEVPLLTEHFNTGVEEPVLRGHRV